MPVNEMFQSRLRTRSLDISGPVTRTPWADLWADQRNVLRDVSEETWADQDRP